MSFSLVSLNCRGLSGIEKRRDVLNYLKQKNFSIYFLQDTHFTADETAQIRSLWGYDIYLSPGKSDARGTAILFNNNFEYNVNNMHTDSDGNLLVLEISVFRKYDLLLINIYGPNKDCPDFFRNISDIVSDFQGDFVLIGGDFNLIQDQQIDSYNYVNINNPKARESVLQIKNIHGLCDTWRVKNDKLRIYTWYRINPIKKARLDYFLISNELMTLVEKVNINPGYRTDHCCVELSISLLDFKKGRGFWKFNNSLLKDETYVKLVKDTISEIKKQYAVTPYILSNIQEIENDKFQARIDDQSFFEQILLCLRGRTIAYSSRKKKEREAEVKLLEEKLKYLDNLRSSCDSQEISENYESTQAKLEQLRKHYINGLFVRTRMKWIESGEKPTKYFLSLEKRNYVNKTVRKLTLENGNVLIQQEDILGEIERFYKNLYSNFDYTLTDVNLDTIIDKQCINILDESMAKNLEGLITKHEALLALKSMKNDKSPGSDGFNVEFFKFFWKDLGDFLLKSLNLAFHKGELSETQKQGIITILPKGDKPREFLKNWRPISLLNVSYKILSACIANRLKTVLDYLIHENQKGLLKGRFIGENTRLIYDVLHTTLEKKIPGIILLIDFEKAFDSISWKFMYQALDFLKFGPDFKKWISVLYKNAKLCVLQNGIFSRFFDIGRGCRQGDPVSPYIFNLCVEIMGHMIRQNINIKGIKLGKEEVRLLQYADDTVIFLDGTQKSLKSALDLLFQFSKFSGLKPNISKTKAVWIGAEVFSNKKICSDSGLQWTSEPFTVLGIQYTANLQDMEFLNFNKKLLDIEKEITHWNKRNITPYGKITVIKSLLMSKITHLFIALPKPNKEWLKSLERTFFRFVWNNKTDRISRKTLILDYEDGGLRVPHLDTVVKSLKLTWIRRLFQTDSTWSRVFNENIGNISDLVRFGCDYAMQLSRETSNIFWKETLSVYCDFMNIVNSNNLYDIMQEPLWYNCRIKIQNKSIFYKSMFDKGFHIVSDLFDVHFKFIQYEHLQDLYSVTIPFTLYEGLKHCILHQWPQIRELPNIPLKDDVYRPKVINILLLNHSGSKLMYDLFISHMKHKPICEAKWTVDLELDASFDWKKIHVNLKHLTTDTKLLWFQYRILHRILCTNKLLFTLKIRTSPLCSICNSTAETISHLFYHCSVVNNVWHLIEDWILQYTNNVVSFDASTVLLGLPGKNNIGLNWIIFLVKYHIYLCSRKNKPIQFNELKQNIYNHYRLEKKIYEFNMNMCLFRKKWNKWETLFAQLS